MRVLPLLLLRSKICKYGVLSFNGNKMITTSGGDTLIYHTEENANKIKWSVPHVRDAYPHYTYMIFHLVFMWWYLSTFALLRTFK